MSDEPQKMSEKPNLSNIAMTHVETDVESALISIDTVMLSLWYELLAQKDMIIKKVQTYWNEFKVCLSFQFQKAAASLPI